MVCVMGHVDHGKTTLLDTLRSGSVAEREAGGITQAIGAFKVPMPDLGLAFDHCTFLDTPGHAAFYRMRDKGANKACSDLAVVVIDCVDGLRPQTLEALKLCEHYDTPMVIAVNKIDLPDADPEAIIQELTNHDVVVEQLGGTTPCVHISGMTGQGLDDLRENVALIAEQEDLLSNPDGRARGFVIEKSLRKGTGGTAALLVRNGTLRIGDVWVCGVQKGKIKTIFDVDNKPVKEVPPSTGCFVGGVGDLSTLGLEFDVVGSESEASDLVKARLANQEDDMMSQGIGMESSVVGDKPINPVEFYNNSNRRKTTAARASIGELLEEGNTADEKRIELNLVIR